MALIGLVLVGCGPATVADACFEFADTVCRKDDACGSPAWPSTAQCRTELTSSCCSGVDCSRPPAASGVAKIRECQAAINAMSCGQWVGGLLPASCR